LNGNKPVLLIEATSKVSPLILALCANLVGSPVEIVGSGEIRLIFERGFGGWSGKGRIFSAVIRVHPSDPLNPRSRIFHQ
jgi:hypothetical protein